MSAGEKLPCLVLEVVEDKEPQFLCAANFTNVDLRVDGVSVWSSSRAGTFHDWQKPGETKTLMLTRIDLTQAELDAVPDL